MQDIQYPVSFVLRIQCASHASRGIHDARLPYTFTKSLRPTLTPNLHQTNMSSSAPLPLR